MVKLPWQNGEESEQTESPVDSDVEVDPLVQCTFQDGTLVVGEDLVYIQRPSRSKFEDKRIEMEQVESVTYVERLVISYIQIGQVGFETSDPSFLTTPVDENTLHFGRGKRDCAKRARDAIQKSVRADG
ncbi:hypothetical protein BRC65_00935 [Halobacteriales archaeon QH_2_65_14]|nr:MAG: hypothetical protein BRC65_00935 [Halobacteriales archaeon QH_2_65_14]